MKIRSIGEFESALDREYSWRKREITTLRFNLKDARHHQKEVFFRSGVVLLYAHWEGLVKFGAKSYIKYINYHGAKYESMKPCFLFFAIKTKLDNSGKVNLQNYSIFEKAHQLFTLPISDKFNVDPDTCISTRENQNLTSTEFKALVGKLGLPYLPEYELREKLIDDKLMFYRNRIAHGESLKGDVTDPDGTFDLLADEILLLLEILRNQLSASIECKNFLA
jgi:hypothetical protein